MKLTFLGATHEVTGSCSLLQVNSKNILIDYGMEQGTNIYENEELPVKASEIDYVFLTHAHIDHSGNLPLLYANGFRGEIYATKSTCALCDIMLRDSAHIQEFEVEWRNRKLKRSGGGEYLPLYTMEDAIGVVTLFKGYTYNQRIRVCGGVEINFVDAGHLLGSACIEIFLTQNDKSEKLVFSGDIGNFDQVLINDPAYIDSADYVVMESTYGDRSHSATGDHIVDLSKILKDTFDRGGNVVIPSFAVGRTQQLLYFIRRIKEDNLVKGHEGFPVYVDSPLAIEATNIFMNTSNEYYNQEALELISKGINPISFPNLKVTLTSDESKLINYDSEPKVIISASGMCDAGRIRHHIKHNLWRNECTILFVGYQSQGTLGRLLVDGVPKVKLFGEEISVEADIAVLGGMSAHADRDGLIRWICALKSKPRRVFVNHGEDRVCEVFAGVLQDELGLNSVAPFSGDAYDLINNVQVAHGSCVRITKPAKLKPRFTSAFLRLKAAGERLMSVISHNEGGSNKDLAKFSSQINALCEKWDR